MTTIQHHPDDELLLAHAAEDRDMSVHLRSVVTEAQPKTAERRPARLGARSKNAPTTKKNR